jgi:hypothetical protein
MVTIVVEGMVETIQREDTVGGYCNATNGVCGEATVEPNVRRDVG